MKIVYIIVGLMLILSTFIMFYHLPTCKDDIDLALDIFTMICTGLGGICLIADTIANWNKSN